MLVGWKSYWCCPYIIYPYLLNIISINWIIGFRFFLQKLKVYTISKDSNDINVFDSTVVLEKDQNLNRNLIDKDALVSFLPFKLLSLMTPVLMGCINNILH